MLKRVLGFSLLCMIGCGGEQSRAHIAADDSRSQNAAFLAMTKEMAREELQRSPLLATRLGVSEAFVGMKYSDKWADYSIAAIAKTKKLRSSIRKRLREFRRSDLSGTAGTTYDVLEQALRNTSTREPFIHISPLRAQYRYGHYTISQLDGPHLSISDSLQTEHPLESKADADDYLTRLDAFERVLSDTCEVIRFEADNGIIAPRFALDGALRVITKMTAPTPSKHPLVTSFNRRLSRVATIDEATRAGLVEKAENLVKDRVYPGFRKLALTVEELVPRASEHAGVWSLPDGDRRYRSALDAFGAGGKTPQEIHQLGLAEVSRIEAQIDAIFRGQGYTQGSVVERYAKLSEESRFLYPNTPAGKKELLATLNAQMDEIARHLPKLVRTLPVADVNIRAIPEHLQDVAPGGYYQGPSIDGSRAGIYWINLKSTKDWPKFSLPSLTYHEANPGHHLQSAIALEIVDMPMVRNLVGFSAHGEGWALYAELLAKELGLYQDDPFGDLGRLQSEMFRAARLVVDTGIHSKRWTRKQAIEYMRNTTGDTIDSITREVERYAVWPGQACAYKLGQLRILELRKRAREKLGNNFEIRKFHDQLLIHGEVPLDVLERNIELWIERENRTAIKSQK